MTSPGPKRLPCYCASLRQATRVVTQIYDGALRPAGLTSTQFNLLEALDLVPEARTGDIAAALAMDSTTVTRSLKLIEEAGWIRPLETKDRRERRWKLTAQGNARLTLARPYWETAQEQVRAALGEAKAGGLQALSYRLVQKLGG